MKIKQKITLNHTSNTLYVYKYKNPGVNRGLEESLILSFGIFLCLLA